MRIASASEDMTVQIWDVTTGNNPFVYTGHTAAVLAVAWSPNGNYIAAGNTAPVNHVSQNLRVPGEEAARRPSPGTLNRL
jgi:WD40 repeat protein